MVFFQAAVAVGWVEDFDFLRSKKRNPQPTLICFQVFAYCKPQITADERRRRSHPRSSVFICGLWKLFSRKKIPGNFWPGTYEPSQASIAGVTGQWPHSRGRQSVCAGSYGKGNIGFIPDRLDPCSSYRDQVSERLIFKAKEKEKKMADCYFWWLTTRIGFSRDSLEI